MMSIARMLEPSDASDILEHPGTIGTFDICNIYNL